MKLELNDEIELCGKALDIVSFLYVLKPGVEISFGEEDKRAIQYIKDLLHERDRQLWKKKDYEESEEQEVFYLTRNGED